MPDYHVYICEPPTLLDDLLEASLRLFHNRTAVIQRVFHEHWTETLEKRIGEMQIESPDDSPAAVEARARAALKLCRKALSDKKWDMLREQYHARIARDEAIRAYVAGQVSRREARAA